MIEFIIIAALAMAFVLYVNAHYLIIGAAGLAVGFLFGGVGFIFNVIPMAFISAVLPAVYTLSSTGSIDILRVLITAGALTAGYIAGGAISIVFIPVKIFNKLVGAVFRLFKL